MQMTIAFLTRLQYLAWLEVVHPLQERSIAAMREINKLWYELSLKNNQQQQRLERPEFQPNAQKQQLWSLFCVFFCFLSLRDDDERESNNTT